MVQEQGLQRGFLLQSNTRTTRTKVKKSPADTTYETSTTNKISKTKGLKSGFLLASSNKAIKAKATTTSGSTNNNGTSPNNNAETQRSESREIPCKKNLIKQDRKPTEKTKSRSSGLSKGFLLSTKTPKSNQPTPPTVVRKTESKPTPVSANQELLLWENRDPSPVRPSGSNSLLFLEDTMNTESSEPAPLAPKPNSPLIAVLDEDEGEAHQETTQSTLRAPLEQGYNVTSIVSSTRQVDGGDDIDDSFGMVQVSSRSRWNEEFVQSDQKTKSQNPSLTMQQKEDSLLGFQQWLSELKWKRKSECAALSTVPEWAKDWTSQKVSWAWDWIHVDLGKKGTRTIHPSLQALVWSLLFYRPTQSLAQYSTFESPDIRQRALATILQLQELVHLKISSKEVEDLKNKSSQGPPLAQWAVALLRHVCPLAVMMKKRTILAQESWKASMHIIVLYAHALSSILETASVADFDFVSQQLDKLLQTQLRWKQKKKDTLKSRVSLCIIQNWIQLNENDQVSNAISDWRDHIGGYIGIAADMHGLGGLAHSFLSSSQESFDLSSVLQLLSDCQDLPVSYEIVWRGLLNTYQRMEQLTESNILLVLHEINHGLCNCQSDRCLQLMLSLADCLLVPLNRTQYHKGSEIRVSLKSLINFLLRSDLEPVVRTQTSRLIVRLIVDHQDAVVVLDEILADHTLSTSFISVLETISDRTKLREDHDAILHSISVKMIHSIVESSEIREWLKTADGVLLVKLGLDARGSELLDFLCRQQTKDGRNNEISTCVLGVLTDVLFGSLSLGTADNFVSTVCSALSQKYKEKTEGCSYVCETIGQYWHNKVLDQDVPPEYFAEISISIAKVFCAAPSSVAPLSLFGFLVGDERGASDGSYTHLTSTVATCVMRVVDFCTTQIDLVFRDWSKYDVFARLAPLLLLRRIPVTFFCISKHYYQSMESMDLGNILAKLAGSLDTVLDLGVSESFLPYESTSEKRVAAEVAGRALNLGNSDVQCNASLFIHACQPAFQALLDKIHSNKFGPEVIAASSQARIALYACCHHMPVALEQLAASGIEYYSVAQFALHLLRLDGNEFEAPLKKEISSLQMGCSEFLGLCIWCDISSKTRSVTPHVLPLSPLVNEAVETISMFLYKTLQGAELSEHEDRLFVFLKPSLLRWPVVFRDQESLSTLQSNFWNILISVAHRCQNEDGSASFRLSV
eukprot:Nitzschia sp. Nitz4//scaffold30_size153850//46135//49909//NITZ4_002769-RA/size153850-processed-gene-0.179-mRNA-1//1//CDS//3329547235//2014//frame0